MTDTKRPFASCGRLTIQRFKIDTDLPATTRIGRGDCATSVEAIPQNPVESEHRLLLFEHAEDGTKSCLLPRAATSCEFLSGVVGLANVAWGTGDLEAI